MTKTTTISPLRQRMIEDMIARGLGANSQRNHVRACKLFAAYLKRSPTEAKADDVRLFQMSLTERGLSPENRNRIMSGVRFLLKVTMRRHDLSAEIYHIKEPQKIPHIMSADEVKRLLAMAGNLQVRTLLSIGYSSGLRVGEVVKLKVKHIDRSLGIIRVEQAKGKKDRHVMLSPDTLALLDAWWPERSARYDRGVPSQERRLFPGRGEGRHLTPRQVTRLFQQTLEAAGVKKTLTLHTLRHSFATHLFDRGVDIRTIQALLGHSKLETTARYTRVATGLITAVESPLDQLGIPYKLQRKRGKVTA